jgi:uncharacterized protein (DUF2147 family)
MNSSIKWAAGLLALGLFFTRSAHAAGDPAFGDWLTPEHDAKVRIAACPGDAAKACGTLVWLQTANDKTGAPARDVRNPDPALRGRPLLGIAMISDFRREASGRWVEGQIYAPGQGKTYRSKMATAPDGSLKVSGCVLIVCQAQTWIRAPGS